jgi:hypothetical protein
MAGEIHFADGKVFTATTWEFDAAAHADPFMLITATGSFDGEGAIKITAPLSAIAYVVEGEK